MDWPQEQSKRQESEIRKATFYLNSQHNKKKSSKRQGHLEASNFSSGHDLTVHEFEPRVGLCADSLEPGARLGFCVSLSLCPSPAHAPSLASSKINEHEIKINL